MAGGKNNTQRIETLESQAASMSARLDVHDALLEGIDKLLHESADVTTGHIAKITVIEEKLVVLTDIKGSMAVVASIKEDLVAIKKDIENLQRWKEELKREKEEAARRRWAFGPNITAALISGVITLVGIGLNYWLNRPR